MAFSTSTFDAFLETSVWGEVWGNVPAGFVQSLAATAAPLLVLEYDKLELRTDVGRERDEFAEKLIFVMVLVRKMYDAGRGNKFVPDGRHVALVHESEFLVGNEFPEHVSSVHAVCLGQALRVFVGANWPEVPDRGDVSSWRELACILEIKRLLVRLFGENCLGLLR